MALFEKQTIPVSQDDWSPRGSDGKGVDHSFSTYGDRLVAIVMTVSGG